MKHINKYIIVIAILLSSSIYAANLTPPQLNSSSSYINTQEDNLGNLYTVYQDGNDADKRGTLVKYNGISWNIVPSFEGVSGTNYINETGYQFQQNAMDVDSNNKLHLLYIDYDPNFDEAILSYQRYNKNSNAYHGWESQTFNTFFSDGLDGSGEYTPLANDLALDINSTDVPIAAYVADDNSVHVRYLNDHGTLGTDSDSSNFDDDTWDNLGTLNLNSSEIDMVIDADVPYLAYKENNGGKLSVMKYTSNAWTLLDANISNGSVSNIDIYVTENNLYISYVDSGTTPVVVKLRRYIPVAFVEESIQTIVQVTSTDTSNIIYTIAGNDKTFFSITNDGNLSFTNKPSFETKDDNNNDGIYEVDVVLVNNDTNLSNQLNYNISLINIDDLPVLNPIAGQTQAEDFSDYNITLVASDDDNDTITYSAASSNQSIATVSIVNGELQVTPVANANGVISVEVNATANSQTATQTFDLNITAVDDAPSFTSQVGSYGVSEDYPSYSFTLAATDVESNPFTYNASASNNKVSVSVVDNNLTITPSANANGTVNVDVNVTQDNNATLFDTYSFTVSINPVNDKPTFTTDLATQTINEDSGIHNFEINATDIEGEDLNITVDSNNTDILTVTSSWDSLLNQGSYDGIALDFNLTTAQDANGMVRVTITAIDTSDANTTQTFDINVSAVNDAPTLQDVANQSKSEDFTPYTIELSATDVDNTSLTYDAKSSDTSIVTLSLTGTTLRVSGVANANGSTTVDVNVTDGELSDTVSFDINVSAVDDAPTLDAITDLNTSEDFNDFNITLNANDTENDTISYTAESNNTSVATVSIVDANVQVTPVANASGIITVEVNATANGQTATRTFIISVSAVDDAPVFSTIETIVNQEDNASSIIDLSTFIVDIDSNMSNITYSASSSDTSIVDVRVINTQLFVIPQANKNGTVSVELNATLDGKTVTQIFTYNLHAVNDAPIVENIHDIALDRTHEGSGVINGVISFAITEDVAVTDVTASSSDGAKLTVDVTNFTNDGATLEYNVAALETGTFTITVKVSDEEYTTTESFNISVRTSDDRLCVDDSLRAVSFDTIKNTNTAQNFIVSDLNFLTSMDTICYGIDISWNVSDATVISNNGEVNTTKVAEGRDNTVEALATITKGEYSVTKQFLLTVTKNTLSSDDILNNITFEMIKAGNARRDAIVSNLNLVSESLGKAITWTSTNNSIIDPFTGVVLRAVNDTNITLSATIENNATALKDFNLKVLAQLIESSVIVAADKDWLTYAQILAENRDNDNILYNLSKPLPATGPSGAIITWATTNNTVITTDGDVFRDDTNDKYVKLTAIISYGGETSTKEFTFKVSKNIVTADTNRTFQRVEDGNNSVSVVYSDVNGTDSNTTANFSDSISSYVERVINNNSIQSIIELFNSVVDVFLNTDGTTESSTEGIDENNNSYVSSIKINLPQSNTDVDENGTVNSVVAYDANTTIEANMDTNGSVSHIVNIGTLQSTKATTTIQGSKVEVDNNGVVETVSEVQLNGTIIRAIARSDSKGKTTTKFITVNLSTGNETDIENTLSDGSVYEAGNIVSIAYENGIIYIETSAPLNDNLYIK